mmetsp:Transcript_9287/g.21235  ORF Transcript_9287/g.21235 Transcript_9287/m.21235 type:complete len:226 (-) Transcript_9287:59-736(-)
MVPCWRMTKREVTAASVAKREMASCGGSPGAGGDTAAPSSLSEWLSLISSSSAAGFETRRSARALFTSSRVATSSISRHRATSVANRRRPCSTTSLLCAGDCASPRSTTTLMNSMSCPNSGKRVQVSTQVRPDTKSSPSRATTSRRSLSVSITTAARARTLSCTISSLTCDRPSCKIWHTEREDTSMGLLLTPTQPKIALRVFAAAMRSSSRSFCALSPPAHSSR